MILPVVVNYIFSFLDCPPIQEMQSYPNSEIREEGEASDILDFPLPRIG